MPIAIKGIYKDGIIKPLEKLEFDTDREEVIIVFPKRIYKGAKERFLKCVGGWKNFNTEKMKEEIYRAREFDVRKEIKI